MINFIINAKPAFTTSPAEDLFILMALALLFLVVLSIVVLIIYSFKELFNYLTKQ
jgi:hypothetical protein